MFRSLTARRSVFRVSRAIALLGLLCLSGCASNLPDLSRCEPVFPPQEVMKDSHYTGFLAENQQALHKCSNSQACEDALFNLGFVYAYPQSPYYNTNLALRHFGRLVRDYPHSPRAYEALVWIDLINRNLSLARKQRALQGQLRQKTATINKLHKQMQRSREIDVEIGRKERQLLH